MNIQEAEMMNRAMLAMKLAQVSNELTGMIKDGRNDSQKFSFIGYEQINAYISKYLLKFKLMIIPEIIESKKTVLEFEQEFYDKFKKTTKKITKRVTTVYIKMSFDIIDAETGYMMSKNFEGESSDYNDKAFPKATTEVQKRFYAKLFNITSGELDADKDTVTVEKNTNQGQEKSEDKPVPKKKEYSEFKERILKLTDGKKENNELVAKLLNGKDIDGLKLGEEQENFYKIVAKSLSMKMEEEEK